VHLLPMHVQSKRRSTAIFLTVQITQSSSLQCSNNAGAGWAGWDHVPSPCFKLCNELPGPTCQRWPPVALTQVDTPQTVSGQAYGDGNYTVTASSTDSNTSQPHQAFDRTPSSMWGSTRLYRSSSPSVYTGTKTTYLDPFRQIHGEWIQLQLPQPIWLHYYRLLSPASSAETFFEYYVLGSTDGVSWHLLDGQDMAPNSEILQVHETRNPTACCCSCTAKHSVQLHSGNAGTEDICVSAS
jgi:hypothetical protein